MSRPPKRIRSTIIRLCWSAADILCMAIVLFLKRRLATRSHEQALASGKRAGTALFIISSILHRLALQEESISRNIRLTFGDDMAPRDVRRTAKESYQHMAMDHFK